MKLPKKTLTFSALAVLAVTFSANPANAKTIKPQYQQNDDYENYDAGYDSNEPYCREFTQVFSIGGEKETGYGTACLQPDGSWQIVSQDDKDDNNDDSDINYVVKEKKIYVEPREVIFAPGHYWHRRPVAYINYSHGGRHYPPYHNHGRHRQWR